MNDAPRAGVGAPRLTPDDLFDLRVRAEALGLLRLGIVRIDHPGLASARAAFDDYLAQGRHGTMDFLARTRQVRLDPGRMLEGAASVLIACVPHGGNAGPVARYAQGSDYHTEVHHRLAAFEQSVHARVPGIRTLVCVDTKPLLERAFAALAGLGFLGKNGCLIAPGLGSYVVLGSLLTTAIWTGEDAPVDAKRVRWDACGSCTRCLDSCPTDAFVQPGQLDARRCISYLTIEHRGPIADSLMSRWGERIAGCDRCQEVCPYNAGVDRIGRAPHVATLPAATNVELSLADLLLVSNSRYRAFVRRRALGRIPRRAMRRNAAIALGHRESWNVAERRALVAAEFDPELSVRQAARWALARRAR